MQKLLTTALLLAVSSTVLAQNKYYSFKVGGKYGVTDTLGNELVKPVHKYCEEFQSGNELALYNFDDEVKDLIVNTSTGNILTFSYIQPGEVKVNNNAYTYVHDKNKLYLRSEQDGKIIPLKEEYSDFKNEGKYIIAKYYAAVVAPPPPMPKPTKSPNKLAPPPPPPPPAMPPPPGFDHYAVIADDDETLKPVMKGLFKSYLPLYNNKSEDSAGIVEVKTFKIGAQPVFYAILFSTDHTHSLYDAKMKLVKKFEMKTEDKEKLAEKASTIMNQTLSLYDAATSPPPMAPSPPGSRNGQPAVVYPVFAVEQSDNGNNQLVWKQSADNVKVIFESPKKFTWDSKDHIIWIGETGTRFKVDTQSGKIFLPKTQWDAAGVIVK
ncbi:hypothetical protein ACTJJB_24460 [Chitinophaga sp. 22536]|uniref:hypothetical protein n=1 Tax=unclassified Chitinophaga TaxID=2619133 RepID=UPI003F8326CC